VEQALLAEINDFVDLLAEMENEYIKERATDVIDIGNRILKNLLQHQDNTTEPIPPNSVLVAHELFPSDTLKLKRSNISAIVTERGGETSHSAILARSLNIPAVTGVQGILEKVHNGQPLLVDGERGIVTIEPSAGNKQTFISQKSRYDEKTIQTEEAEQQKECITSDGIRIKLYANLARPYEIDLVHKYQLDGVGLFRTEHLFLSRTSPPGAEEQEEIYRGMVTGLSDKPLTIRTFDLGADKLASFLSLGHETNPYMGLRGIRLALQEKTLFRTQLQAILRASGHGQTRILLPMVIQKEDIQETRALLLEEAESLGVEFVPPLGIMIETPAAVFSLDSLLEEVDYVSIGTNDLTQFILATDRNASELLDIHSVLQPAVMRAVMEVVRVTQKKNVPVSVCGEAASDPLLACLFIGLGLRELSMSPIKTNSVKHVLRSMSITQLQDIAFQAISHSSREEVWKFLQNSMTRFPPEVLCS
jgi:phosphoenolpyruvate-protein phosphotransferase